MGESGGMYCVRLVMGVGNITIKCDCHILGLINLEKMEYHYYLHKMSWQLSDSEINRPSIAQYNSNKLDKNRVPLLSSGNNTRHLLINVAHPNTRLLPTCFVS